MASPYETDEFQEDGALDERDELIDWLVQRIEHATGEDEFSGVEVFGVRADIAMLATIIGAHGGGDSIKRAQVQEWARKVDECVTIEEKRGFTGWPDEAWAEWRAGCQQTVRNLLRVLEERGPDRGDDEGNRG